MRRVRGLPTPVLLGGLLALAALVAVGAWVVPGMFSSDSGTDLALEDLSALEVTEAFFEAQEDGDCELLLELVTEASWSDRGARSGDEFLEQCADAVAGYTPTEPRFQYQYMDGDEPIDPPYGGDPEQQGVDRALVLPMTVRVGQHPREVQYAGENVHHSEDGIAAGRLERERGAWRVETDERIFHIGPAIHEVLAGYLEAHNEGDCEGLVPYVSDEVWSDGGERSRDELIAQCTEAARARQSLGTPSAEAYSADVTVEDGRASVVVGFGGSDSAHEEEVVLIEDGQRWRLDRRDEVSVGAQPGTVLNYLRYLELQSRLLEAVSAGGGECSSRVMNLDPEPPEGEIVVAAERAFCSSATGASVAVQEHPDAAAARSAAEERAQELLEEEVSADEDSVRERRPNEPAEVPGMPEAAAVRANCDLDGCFALHAFLPHEHMVVQVEVNRFVELEDGNMTHVAEILSAQLERLATP